MVLIAVTGPVGAGKTTLLSNVPQWAASVDGFLQIAGERDDAQRGASSYRLRFLRDGTDLEFLSRTPEGYHFAEQSLDHCRAWAATLDAEVVVLDEFGKWESQGGGHLAIWPLVAASSASAVVVSVRDGLLQQIEEQIGVTFDVVIDLAEPGADDRLRAVLSQVRDWERVGIYGTGAGGIEASVGAAFHSFKFPLTGLVMSATQVVVMSMAAEKLQRRDRMVWVSMISAGLKALSPAGSRLGPMLAITVQGILATAAYWILGWNRMGAFLAGSLASAWAGLQGLLVQYLLLGSNLQRAFDTIAKWVHDRWHVSTPSMIAVVLAIACLYAVIGGFAVSTAWARRNKLGAKVDKAILKGDQTVAKHIRQPFWKSALGLLRPAFLLPTAIVAAVLFAAGSSASDIAMLVLRTLGVGLALLGLVRWIDPAGFVRYLRKKGRWGPAYALSRIFK